MINKKTTLTILIGMIMSGSALANTAPSILDVNNAPEQEVPAELPVKSFEYKTGDELTYTLTEDERRTIEAKKEAIIGYLYEETELQGLRDILGNSAKQDDWEAQKTTVAPLTPEQVMEIRNLLQLVEKSKNKPLQEVDFDIRTVNIDLDASKPVEINVAKGYVSSIQFYDETGAPWPIEGELIGNSTAFAKHTMGERNHVASFQVKQQFSESNALVNLKGFDSTIVIKLNGSDEKFDSRLTVRIPKLGPNAEVMTLHPATKYQKLDKQLTDVLNGDIIKSSKKFSFQDVEGTAYYTDGYLYIRTPHKLVIPPPIDAQHSSGINAYKTAPSEDFQFLVDGEMVVTSIDEIFEVEIKHKNSIFK